MSDMLEDIKKVKELLEQRKSFKGHHGRPGKRGGSLPKGQGGTVLKPPSHPNPPIKATPFEDRVSVMSGKDWHKTEQDMVEKYGKDWKNDYTWMKHEGIWHVVNKVRKGKTVGVVKRDYVSEAMKPEAKAAAARGLKAFAEYYADNETGLSRMYTKQSVQEAMPAILDEKIRDAWYKDSRTSFQAVTATDIVGIYDFHREHMDVPTIPEPAKSTEAKTLRQRADAEYQKVRNAAIDWQYLTAQNGGMARKSDLDKWLVSRYAMTLAEAHDISNSIEEERYFTTGRDGVKWRGYSKNSEYSNRRPEPKLEQYPDLSAKYAKPTAAKIPEPAKPVTVKPTAAKEPWQMTKAEFEADKTIKSRMRIEEWNTRGSPGFPPGPELPSVAQKIVVAERAGYILPRDASKVIKADWHKLNIEAALAEGKSVPSEVLVDYPDLVVKPSEVSSSSAHNYAGTIVDAHGESVGKIAITNDGDKWDVKIHKAGTLVLHVLRKSGADAIKTVDEAIKLQFGEKAKRQTKK